MKMRVVAALMLAAPMAFAQQNPAPDQTFCDPDSYPYDAVAAAPYSHRVVFEDAHVRVLEINLPALATEPIHIHSLPSVLMGEGGGKEAKFRYTTYRMEAGKFVEVEHHDIQPTDGYRAIWAPPEGPHSITNIGQVSVKFTRIEIKPETCAR